MPNFADYQSRDLAPGWLREEWGGKYLRGFGERKDAEVALLKEAVKCRFPVGTGHYVTITAGVNDKLDFVLAAFTRVATLNPGRYTDEAIVVEVDRALTAAFYDTWGVSLDGGHLRITRNGVWAPKAATGANVARNAWPTLGWAAVDYAQDTISRLAPNALATVTEGAAPLDALALIAVERGIPRGQTETEGSHRSRVWAAWDSWRWAGTPYGMLLAFYWAGYRPSSGKVILQTETERQYALREDFDPAVHTPENALTTTNIGPVSLGGSPELWSQFAVLFVDPLPKSWAPTPPADGSPEVSAIRSLVAAWKPGHMRCVKLAVVGGRLLGYPTDDTFNTYTGQTIGQVGAGVSATWTPPAT
jgi:hypothetical protein